ncbi:MAG: NAD+ synthase [Candidatus Nanohaloarchaea archaeon]|nr:NAD+ synthase [Candidatus Nanohaloarchaea archaeon]
MVDIQHARTEIEAFLRDYLADSGADGYVVGVSGGLDSAATLQLAVNAVGPDRVHALVMPGDASQAENVADAHRLCDGLGVTTDEISIDDIVAGFADAAPVDPDDVAAGNAAVRTRMVLLYMVANQEDRLVLGTSNRSELLVGYFTKWGDQAADVRPIVDLYKTEVRELARELGLPDTFIEKPPTAGMWQGQTDEAELGASYEEIDAVLQRYVDRSQDVGAVVEDAGIDRETVEQVAALHEDSAHKRGPVPHPALR